MDEVRTLRPNWHQARQSAYDAAAKLPPRPLPLPDCLGAELAEPIVAEAGLPHYDSAAMDGWAVAGSGPWILLEPNSGVEPSTGVDPSTKVRLFPGQAVPIVTGGLVPPGAHAVLRSESGTLSTDAEGLPQLELSGEAKPGEPRRSQHIRKVGEEAAPGTVVVEPGARLNPAHLAIAAAVGRDELKVSGAATVRLLFTGDEVIEAGTPGSGQVRDVFGMQLAQTAAMIGAKVSGQSRIPDSRDELTAAFFAADDDVLLTTGGTGTSGADHVRPALAEVGAEILVDSIAIRPGGPGLLARLPNGTFVVGLPGNPLAAFVAFALLFEPLLRALRGLPLAGPAQLPSGAAITPFNGSTKAVPFTEVFGMASPREHAQAGMLRGLADSAGLMIIPPHGARLGENLPILTLPWQRNP